LNSNSVLNKNIRQVLPYADIVEASLNLVPKIKLYLLNDTNMQHRFSPNEIQNIWSNTPYWSFCWASGHALAKYFSDNTQLIYAKNILDFGSGSGVVAIAAKFLGAAEVIALDEDPHAIIATQENAKLNNLEITTIQNLNQLDTPIDIVIAADVLYDRFNLPLLDDFPKLAPTTYIADSRIKNLANNMYFKIKELEADTLPAIEAKEFRHVTIFKNKDKL